jgi:hypothetical protein
MGRICRWVTAVPEGGPLDGRGHRRCDALEGLEIVVLVQLNVGVGNYILWSRPNHCPGVEICNSYCVLYRPVAGDPHTDVATILTLAGRASPAVAWHDPAQGEIKGGAVHAGTRMDAATLAAVTAIDQGFISRSEAGMVEPCLGHLGHAGEGVRDDDERVHILRRLDAPLAESLIASHEQLAAAARRFPNGIETIFEEAEERRQHLAASGAICDGGFIMAGDAPRHP